MSAYNNRPEIAEFVHMCMGVLHFIPETGVISQFEVTIPIASDD